MKLVINTIYGGFDLNQNLADLLGITTPTDAIETRYNANLVAYVEAGQSISEHSFCKPAVVQIPDEATDWTIDEYDGLERVTYVLNGKLHYEHGWSCFN